MMNVYQRKSCKKGQALPEYGLILALVVSVGVIGIQILGVDISAFLSDFAVNLLSTTDNL